MNTLKTLLKKFPFAYACNEQFKKCQVILLENRLRLIKADKTIKIPTYEERYRDIKKIVTDDVMQKIVADFDTSKEYITRKILFGCIRKKMSIIVYLLLLLQAKRTLK